MKLTKKIIYSGSITLLTGLHIGGTNSSVGIGGPDKLVVRNPLNQLPYIPGSSLKGKLRSLTELVNRETNGGNPSDNPKSKSGQLFGTAAKDGGGRPSRLIVRDAELDVNSCDLNKTDLPYTETKTEVSIDRITAKANPRTFERVPAGAKFKLSMVLNVFDTDDEDSLKATLKQAIALLQDDYLGGQGSRGYGQVKIDIISIDEHTEEYYLSAKEEK